MAAAKMLAQKAGFPVSPALQSWVVSCVRERSRCPASRAGFCVETRICADSFEKEGTTEHWVRHSDAFPVHYLKGSRVVCCVNIYYWLVCYVKEGLNRWLTQQQINCKSRKDEGCWVQPCSSSGSSLPPFLSFLFIFNSRWRLILAAWEHWLTWELPSEGVLSIMKIDCIWEDAISKPTSHLKGVECPLACRYAGVSPP